MSPEIKRLRKAISAIDRIVRDDFCEELDCEDLDTIPAKRLRGLLKTAAEKIGLIYRLAHGFNREHSCYSVHKEWRKLADEILKEEVK